MACHITAYAQCDALARSGSDHATGDTGHRTFVLGQDGLRSLGMPTRLIVLTVALILCLGSLVGLSLIRQSGGNASAVSSGKALIGGPFSLVNQRGERMTEKDFEGEYMLAYFGYTFCPDFCPMGLSTITAALEMMPQEAAAKVTPVFFSVDPARDTVEQLADYVPHFHPRLIALTGSDEEVKAAAQAYRIYYAIPPHEGEEDYAVDHSTFTYLMGPDGSYLTHFNHDVSPEEIVEQLNQAMKNS